MKKIISLILTIAIMTTMFTGAFAQEETKELEIETGSNGIVKIYDNGYELLYTDGNTYLSTDTIIKKYDVAVSESASIENGKTIITELALTFKGKQLNIDLNDKTQVIIRGYTDFINIELLFKFLYS